MSPCMPKHLRRFRDEEDGLVMTEFLILLPLLLWAFMALVVYWDAFRTINAAQKASYAVSDLVSRQGEDIPRSFLTGMEDVMEYLTGTEGRVKMRITSLQWNETQQRMVLIFSESPHSRMVPLTAAEVNAANFRAKIPNMAHLDTVVVVETSMAYSPGFNVGIPFTNFENFIVTRPRLRRVCLVGTTCPGV